MSPERARVCAVCGAATVGALVAVLLAAAPASAQTYAISWWTVDGGGAMNSTGGTYTLSGTAGPIPNTVSVSAATYDPAPGNNSSTIQTPVNTDLIFKDGFQ